MFAPGQGSRDGDPSVVGGLACWDAEGVAVTALYRTARATPAAAEIPGEPSLLLKSPTHLELAPPWSILVAPSAPRSRTDQQPPAAIALRHRDRRSACPRQETPLLQWWAAGHRSGRRSSPVVSARRDA